MIPARNSVSPDGARKAPKPDSSRLWGTHTLCASQGIRDHGGSVGEPVCSVFVFEGVPSLNLPERLAPFRPFQAHDDRVSDITQQNRAGGSAASPVPKAGAVRLTRPLPHPLSEVNYIAHSEAPHSFSQDECEAGGIACLQKGFARS